MQGKIHRVYTPTNISPKPEKYEKIIAKVMAQYLKNNIRFIRRTCTTTPDILAIELNQVWEIKNIRGNNKNTIARNLKGIYRQSENVVISLFRTKMTLDEAIAQTKKKLANANRLKRVVIISRDKKIVVIK